MKMETKIIMVIMVLILISGCDNTTPDFEFSYDDTYSLGLDIISMDATDKLVKECELEVVYYNKSVPHYKKVERCNYPHLVVKCDTDYAIVNGSECYIIQKECKNYTEFDYTEIVVKNKTECNKIITIQPYNTHVCKDRNMNYHCDSLSQYYLLPNGKCNNIELGNRLCRSGWVPLIYQKQVLEYEKERKGCTINGNQVVCDDSKDDGNGDGICQPGETCYYYNLTSAVELKEVTDKVITKEITIK